MVRETYKMVKDPTSRNTDVLCDGGLTRSSDEASVMEVERRGRVTQSVSESTTGNSGKTEQTETKGIPITKSMVWNAFKKVKRKKGAGGIDNKSILQFEKKLSGNLYKIWNRMTSGTYFPPPVMEVEIPKPNGKLRKLGIPTVGDRVAQQVIKDVIESRLDAVFHENSYAYRPLKSAHQAVEQVRQNVRKYRWVIDLDVSKFFDSVDHALLLKALEHHVEEKWANMYVKRWLEAPVEKKDGTQYTRDGCGTPQGGVVSPLLANLFLHYAFDLWFGREFKDVRFVRYADDIIVHCHSEKQAHFILDKIKRRLTSCGLELNAEKSKMVYCKTSNRFDPFPVVQFDFLGFSFQPRTARAEHGLFLGFDCAISKTKEKTILAELREMKIQRMTSSTIEDISERVSDKIRGWMNYFGKFGLTEMNRIFMIFNKRLIKWTVRRYKRFQKSKKKALSWLRNLMRTQPKLFPHWQKGFCF